MYSGQLKAALGYSQAQVEGLASPLLALLVVGWLPGSGVRCAAPPPAPGAQVLACASLLCMQVQVPAPFIGLATLAFGTKRLVLSRSADRAWRMQAWACGDACEGCPS